MPWWPAPSAMSPVCSTVAVPGSKSLTNRYLVLAALSALGSPSPHGTRDTADERPDGDTATTFAAQHSHSAAHSDGRTSVQITAPLVSRDTELMADALTMLGARIERAADDSVWYVTPIDRYARSNSSLSASLRKIDCGLAGTVMRFVPPVAALTCGTTMIDGDAAARVRPMTAVADGLRQLDVSIDGDRLPLTVTSDGHVSGGVVTIDASASSQFVSALLLVGASFEHGIDLRHSGGPLPSLPHIRMTINLLRAAGVQVREYTADSTEIVSSGSDVHKENLPTHIPTHIAQSSSESASPTEDVPVPESMRWVVSPGPINQADVVVEPDLSNAAPFLAAAMLTGGCMRIPHWPLHTTQPGAELPHIFEAMGGYVRMIPTDGECGDNSLTTVTLELTGPEGGTVTPLDMNLHAVGELAPTIAAVAALAPGVSYLRDIGQLRGHETNRLAALVAELGKIGVVAEEVGDDLVIHGAQAASLHGADLESYNDHRMATFGALLGLVIPCVRVANISTTSKTLPQFVHLWEQMLAQSSAHINQGSRSA